MGILRQGEVITRKPHRCWGCGRTFPKAHRMGFCVSTDMGKVATTYWCRVCETVMRAIYAQEGDCVEFEELPKLEPELWESLRAEVEGEFGAPGKAAVKEAKTG